MSRFRFRIEPARLLLGAAILLATISIVALQGRFAASSGQLVTEHEAIPIEALYSDDPALQIIDLPVDSLLRTLQPY